MRTIDICEVHGKTSFFKSKCIKCLEENLKEPVYRIETINNKNYLLGEEITESSYLNRFLWLLTDKNKKTISMLMSDYIRSCPGIYGIFSKRQNGKVGECLYIGQSVNVQRRIEEHKNNILQAREDLKTHNRTVDSVYYNLAFIGYENIKFVQLIELTNDIWSSLDIREAEECLAVFEQYCIDCFSPRYNISAARKSSFTKKNDIQLHIKKKNNESDKKQYLDLYQKFK